MTGPPAGSPGATRQVLLEPPPHRLCTRVVRFLPATLMQQTLLIGFIYPPDCFPSSPPPLLSPSPPPSSLHLQPDPPPSLHSLPLWPPQQPLPLLLWWMKLKILSAAAQKNNKKQRLYFLAHIISEDDNPSVVEADTWLSVHLLHSA